MQHKAEKRQAALTTQSAGAPTCVRVGCVSPESSCVFPDVLSEAFMSGNWGTWGQIAWFSVSLGGLVDFQGSATADFSR